MKRLKVAEGKKEAKQKSVHEKLLDDEMIEQDDAIAYHNMLKAIPGLKDAGFFNYPRNWVISNLVPDDVAKSLERVMKFLSDQVYPWVLIRDKIKPEKKKIFLRR